MSIQKNMNKNHKVNEFYSHIVLKSQENQNNDFNSRLTQKRRPIFTQSSEKRSNSRSSSARRQIFNSLQKSQKIDNNFTTPQKNHIKFKQIARLSNKSSFQSDEQIGNENQINSFNEDNIQDNSNIERRRVKQIQVYNETQEEWKKSLEVVKKKLFVQMIEQNDEKVQFNVQNIQRTKLKYNNVNVNNRRSQEKQFLSEQGQSRDRSRNQEYFISKIKNFITTRKSQQQQKQHPQESYSFRQNQQKIDLKKQDEQTKSNKNKSDQFKTIKSPTSIFSLSNNNNNNKLIANQLNPVKIKDIALSLRQLHKKMLQKSVTCEKVNQQNLKLRQQNITLRQLNDRLKFNLTSLSLSHRHRQSQKQTNLSNNNHDSKIIQKQNLEYKKRILRAKGIVNNLLLVGENQQGQKGSIVNIKASLQQIIKVLEI